MLSQWAARGVCGARGVAGPAAAAAAGGGGGARLDPGREEAEEDVARGGEMAAENKPEDDHGNSNGSHVKIFLPKKLLECLPKCSSLPKERHRWNTNEVANFFSFDSTFLGAYWLFSCSRKLRKYCR
ncbi:Krueppel-like factor 7 [Platysternon megacephalum]|uniref:Krueppel-like factor 7 n=1 Tax=Platysternon megacephalum TaxID=55544 RepID=A0A4D9F6W5_9SAUR|nr:Krueppel-like factor 7 [Platysternon megacephalum]